MEKHTECKNAGITLVALVITIIILLILAGISIQAITNTGLFTQANNAKKEEQIAQITEWLNLKLMEERAFNPLGTAEEIIKATRTSSYGNTELSKMGKKVVVDESISTIEDGEQVDVYFYVQVDEYVYKVDITGAQFIGEKGKFPSVPDLTEGDITFKYFVDEQEIDKETWTNKNVTITASTTVDEYTLQTSTDGINWSSTNKQTFTENGTMYVALSDGKNQGGAVTANVTNIDILPPIELIPKISTENNNIIIDVSEAKDAESTEKYGQSGISKIYFSRDNGTTWQPSDDSKATATTYTYTEINPEANYKIKVKLIDNAGNQIITTALDLKDYIAIITFNSNGGEGSMANIVEMKGKNVTLAQNEFTSGDKIFKKWNTKADGTGTDYDDKTTITLNENTTLFAQWEKSSYVLTSTVLSNGSSYKATILENLYNTYAGISLKGTNTKLNGLNGDMYNYYTPHIEFTVDLSGYSTLSFYVRKVNNHRYGSCKNI